MSLPLVQHSIATQAVRTPYWRTILRQNFRTLTELAAFLELTPEQIAMLDAEAAFQINLPRRLAAKIPKKTTDDPLFLQFVPLKLEQEIHPDYVQDPVSDANFQLEDKLLQKYDKRALIISTSACAMHCRFCFRKNFDYQTQDKSFAKELECIRNNPTLDEIILSGGDPLSLSDEVLGELLTNLSNIPHIKRIRFHTRFIMGIPERVDNSFLQALKACKKQLWFIIHANHIREFDDDIWHALRKIQLLGIPVLNQSVLLKGVNDDHDSLHKLFSGLIDHGITPYYLHGFDRVQGSSHFEVETKHGLELISRLMTSLPGYAIPKYVQEIPGKKSKTTITSSQQ